MALRLRWSLKAADDLEELLDFVGERSPQAAARLAGEIRDLIRRLPEHPRLGRKVPSYDRDDLRERFVHPYRIIYRLHPGAIEITRILRESRQLPDDPEDL